MNAFIEGLSKKEVFTTILVWFAANWTAILGMLIFVVKQKISTQSMKKENKDMLLAATAELKELSQDIIKNNYEALEEKMDNLLQIVCKKFNLEKSDLEKEYQDLKKEIEEAKANLIDLDQVDTNTEETKEGE